MVEIEGAIVRSFSPLRDNFTEWHIHISAQGTETDVLSYYTSSISAIFGFTFCNQLLTPDIYSMELTGLELRTLILGLGFITQILGLGFVTLTLWLELVKPNPRVRVRNPRVMVRITPIPGLRFVSLAS